MTPEEFRAAGHRLIDWIADYRSRVEPYPVMARTEPGAIKALPRGGLQAEPRPLVVYTSAQSHSSVAKAALLAGFGRDNIRLIAHDASYAMRADALAAAVDADCRGGAIPCAVVATSGSTTSTAFDPLDAIGEAAAEHRLWLHVDAAMAGSAM